MKNSQLIRLQSTGYICTTGAGKFRPPTTRQTTNLVVDPSNLIRSAVDLFAIGYHNPRPSRWSDLTDEKASDLGALT
jgi:hypothetical protein